VIEPVAWALAVALLVEAAAVVASRRSGRRFAERPPGSEPDDRAASDATLRSIHALHPYFGFTLRPGRTPADVIHRGGIHAMCSGFETVSDLGERAAIPEPPPWLHLPANRLGMWSSRPFPYQPRAGEIVIGLFGGSAASYFTLQGAEALDQRLRSIPELGGSEAVVLNFAIPGGKQPQQLAVLNYVLSRGQHLDLAINLDGINELLWGSYNHHVQGVDFTLPTTHLLAPLKHLVHGGSAGVEGVLALADSIRSRLRADRIARLRSRMPSAALRLLLGGAERRLRGASSRRFAAATRAGVDPDSDPLPFAPAAAAPPPLAEYWRDCSLQLHRVCLAHGIIYLHILQPTPYTSGRQATGTERAFLDPDGPNARLVAEHYPRLAELGGELRRAGVPFASADAAFAQMPLTLFSDVWGHLNQLGNEALAEFIGLQVERIVREPAVAAHA
jgi:hypothetical protein